MRGREHQHRIMDWLRDLGATKICLAQKRGKHPKLSFVFDGKGCRVPIACSPGDRRATKNAIRQLQHKIRERTFQ